jgi:peptide/nickel transport system permease protein
VLNYVAHRLLIMIPTLLAISFIVFVIIQLPPGDYLETYVAELESQGENVDPEKIAFLRAEYGFDRPFLEQYATWVFGMLQGDFGYSFEYSLPVNDVVGDRLWLTVFVSFATIIFTWVISFPIGVYSATHQYGWGDYGLTFLGFIGLATTNFLLALVLLYIANVYFGTSVGTAGMIRRLRANLLDELEKQYVVTGRAKGLPPFRLLVKYPLRMSLNPFISDIGSLLPQVISGAAIVSVVLNLPTTGPMLLDALKSQDMYLAGSFLMFLAALTVVGVLVSDLLLAMLDPRIRFQGGSR